jgi:phosphatidate cytidylyltransferase
LSAKGRSLRLRYVSAAIGIPVGLGSCLFSPTLFAALATVLITIGMVELCAMARTRGLAPHSIIGASCSIAICVLAWIGQPLDLLYSLAAATIIVCTFAMARTRRDAIANIAVTVFGIVYVGWFCSHVISLRMLPLDGGDANVNFGGAGYVIMLLLLLWLGDGGAFFVGTAWGKHKLLPTVSPNKTVEGAVGGLALTLIGSMLIRDAGLLLAGFKVALFPDFGVGRYLLIGTGISVSGQVGDLVESYLKRDAGLKDTGNLMPGHGGFLDRFDSLAFAAPLFYFFLKFANV